MKILVAGGAGFIGANLCRFLLGKGHSVICLDNLCSGRFANLDSILQNPNFTFIEHDIINSIDIAADQIYNLACPASPVFYGRDPIFTLKTSVMGTLNLLELASKNKAVMLQASTSEVYGDPQVHPQIESYWGNVNPIGPRACYDEGKRSGETLCFDFIRCHDLDVRVVRIFNTYGPYMQPDDGRVVSNFILQAIKGEDITIYGDGTQTRSFCYIDDLVKGLDLMMNNQKKDISPMNLGNPKEFTIKELALKIIEMTGSKSGIIYKALPQDDPRKRRPDIGKAKGILEWKPEIELAQGLEKTISYFKREALK